MVRVDMAVARAAITKRLRRRRRTATRRLARMRRRQQKQVAAAEHARQARRASVAAWVAEEARLARERQAAQGGRKDTQEEMDESESAKRDVETPAQRRRSVTFANDVLVTEIPVAAGETLPKPVSSPIGVAVKHGAITKQRLGEMMVGVGSRRVPKRARYVAFADDWSDSSDDEEGDPDFVPEQGPDAGVVRPKSRRTRRIRPTRLAGGSSSPQGPAKQLATTAGVASDAVFSPLGGSRISDDEFAAIFKASAKDAERFAATFKKLNSADRNEGDDTR